MTQIIRFQLIKYLISGGIGATTLLAGAYLLKDILGLYYLLASTLALTIAVLVSFSLQRFWTFAITHRNGIKFQFVYYVILALMNLAVNAALMYIFVDIINIWYLVSQALSSSMVAIWSLFVYKYYIFAEQPKNYLGDNSVNKTTFDYSP